MNKENCALKLVDEIILYHDARSKNIKKILSTSWVSTTAFFPFWFKEDFVDAVARSMRVTWIQIFNFQEGLVFET